MHYFVIFNCVLFLSLFPIASAQFSDDINASLTENKGHQREFLNQNGTDANTAEDDSGRFVLNLFRRAVTPYASFVMHPCIFTSYKSI